MSGKACDSSTGYGAAGSESESYAYAYRLERVPIKVGQRSRSIVDCGDGWRHQITLPAIQCDAAKPERQNLAVVERHGDSVSQDPVFDE